LINKGFQIIDRMLGDALPVPLKNRGHLGQNMGGQAGNLDPGQDQKPAVVGNKGETVFPVFLGPADKIVPDTDIIELLFAWQGV
jgi:hypothetical protein